MILVVEPVARRVSAALPNSAFPLPLFITKPPLAVIVGVVILAAACAGAASAPVAATAPAVTATADTRRRFFMPIIKVNTPNTPDLLSYEGTAVL